MGLVLQKGSFLARMKPPVTSTVTEGTSGASTPSGTKPRLTRSTRGRQVATAQQDCRQHDHSANDLQALRAQEDGA